MVRLVNVKSRLGEDAVSELLAFSVFNPTREKLQKRTDSYIADKSVKAVVLSDKGRLVALAVFKVEEKTATVLDLAVDAKLRGKGFGRRILELIAKKNDVWKIKAETDSEAVGFYEKCGFEAEKIPTEYSTERYLCEKTVKGRFSEGLHNGFRTALLAVGSLLLLNGLFVLIYSTAIMAIVSTVIAGLCFLLCGAFYKFIRFRVHAVFKIAFSAFVLTVAAVMGFVYIYGLNDTVTYREDAIVVLGAGLHGDRLSKTLKHRLDAALEYHRNNPEAVIVVTGGQGLGETVTEGYAMEKYLLENGVPKNKILREELSTSTEENFRFARALLDQHFEKEYNVAYITSDFHIYRAGVKAEREGYGELTHLHSTADIASFFPNGLREFLAVAHLWVFE